MGLNQIIAEIFYCSQAGQHFISGITILMWQLLNAKQPNTQSVLPLAHKVLSHYMWSTFLHTFVLRSAGAATRVSTLNLIFQVAVRGEDTNVWLQLDQMTRYLFESLTTVLGIDHVTVLCADWPHVHADMWWAIAVHRGRETTPSRIVPRRRVSWNWEIHWQWQRGTEHNITRTQQG